MHEGFPADIIAKTHRVKRRVTVLRRFSNQINGPDSICNIADTFQYVLERNVGCSAAAAWETDTAFTEVVATTDTTISLKYKKAGAALLRATITSGCIGLSAEKTINIAKQASSLDLGRDTILCANNNYKLRAGSGFKSYSWLPGISTDSTIIVSTPGIYKLTATDYCNKTFTDSVIIRPASFMFTAGNDTSKCNSDSVMLTATPGFINYSWRPAYNLQNVSSTIVKVFPAIDTFYTVQAEKWIGCFVNDTIRISVKTSPKIYLGGDTSLCFGQRLTLNSGNGFNAYKWSDGNVGPQTIISTAGSYSINATTSDGCHSYDTINISIHALPVVNLDHNTGMCSGSSRNLNAGNYISYYWQDGSTNRSFTAKGTGTYFVHVTDQNGCIGSDTTYITTIFKLPSAFLPADTAMCSYGSLFIGSVQSFSSYVWNTNETTNTIEIDKPGQYWLKVKDDNNCVGSDTINVGVKDCISGLYVPTAFTPNGDNKNDELRALLFGDIKTFDFKIYNRYGKIVFQTSTLKDGWDGKLNGIQQDTGAYVWVCSFQLGNEPRKIEKGTIVLIR